MGCWPADLVLRPVTLPTVRVVDEMIPPPTETMDLPRATGAKRTDLKVDMTWRLWAWAETASDMYVDAPDAVEVTFYNI
jgi:hypothetical protein